MANSTDLNIISADDEPCHIDDWVTHNIESVAYAVARLQHIQESMIENHSGEALKRIRFQLWFLAEEMQRLREALGKPGSVN